MYFKERLYQKYIALFLMYFLSMASHSALIAVYLGDLGKSASEISIVLVAANLLALVIQPLATELGERQGIKRAMTLLLAVTLLISSGFYFTTSIWLLALIYGSVNALIFSVLPFFEQLATLSPYRYGLIRCWGTIGFAVGAQLIGLTYQYLFPRSIFLVFMLSVVLTVWLLHSLMREPGVAVNRQEQKETAELQERVTYRAMFSQKLVVVYVLIAFVAQGANMINSTYLPVLLTESGASVASASLVISIGMIGEILAMFRSHAYMDRFSNKQLLTAVLVLNIIEFSANAFIHNFILLAIINILTKYTAWGTFIMLNIKIVHTLLGSRGMATGLAAVQVISRSLGTVFFQSLAGPIIDNWGIQAIYLTLALFSAGSLLTTRILFPIPEQPEEPLFS